MKKLFIMLFAFMANMLMGAAVAASVGLSPIVGGLVINGVAIASPLMGIENVLRTGVYAEIWTGEMVKAFRTSMDSLGWIAKIRSYDQYAENDVIHFVNLGGDPDVLVNNTTYPLDIQNLADADKAISLDKYQTKATRITDDELRAASYDKMASVVERHKESIDKTKYARAIHALAPASHATATPVILTTGASAGTRKRITATDIISLKALFDAQKVPTAGRILVLSTDHVNDLLLLDQKFADQYHNYSTGKISNLYGFEVYEYTDNPYYTQTKAKVAYGAVPAATEFMASVAFYAPRMMKVTGSTKAYLSEAKSNPTTQENLLNYRHYFICLPLKNEAIGAIASASV